MQKIYYTVYETTNLVNGKIYIGIHRTKNIHDTYLGSGNIIKQAIKKYGREHFNKRILFIFDTLKEASDKEEELVTLDFIKLSSNYNQIPGGVGNKSGTHAKCEKVLDDHLDENILIEEEILKILSEKYDKKKSKLIIQIERTKQTCRERYGVDFWAQLPESKEKVKNTILKNYGVDHITKIPEIRDSIIEKMHETMNEKYGMIYSKTIEGREKNRADTLQRYENGWVHPKLNKITITDGYSNLTVEKDFIIPDNWYRGMTKKDTSGFNNSNFGTIWINNGKENIRHEAIDPIPEGFKLGVLRRKQIWITNGRINRKIYETSPIPVNFYLGKTKILKNRDFSTCLINNGITCKKHPRQEEIPSGWVYGRLPKS
jgi:hypothetical protein